MYLSGTSLHLTIQKNSSIYVCWTQTSKIMWKIMFVFYFILHFWRNVAQANLSGLSLIIAAYLLILNTRGRIQRKTWYMKFIDQIFIKTPNPKCRLNWCLIEFIDWRYNQTCWYFRSLLWTSAPLTWFNYLPPPPPCGNKYRGTITVWQGGGAPPTDKHLPSSTFTGQFLRNAYI
jgi:hypothetical protein